MEASCCLNMCLMKHCRECDIGSSKSKVTEEGIAEAHGAGLGQIMSLVFW